MVYFRGKFRSHKMRKIVWMLKGFSLAIVGLVLVGLFMFGRTSDSFFEISKNLEIFNNVFKELNTSYVDPIEPGKMVKTGITAMLAELDPYTNIITEADLEDFEFQTTGKYGGIGASMRVKNDT